MIAHLPSSACMQSPRLVACQRSRRLPVATASASSSGSSASSASAAQLSRRQAVAIAPLVALWAVAPEALADEAPSASGAKVTARASCAN